MIDTKTLDFLRRLNKNNDRMWFKAHKGEYESALADFTELVGALLFRIAEFEPGVMGTEPKECLFRIYRDLRFSKDKTPYKTYFSASLGPEGKKHFGPGYYIHLEPGSTYLAGGLYRPDSKSLFEIRMYISSHLRQFRSVVESPVFMETFGRLGGEKLKRSPAGFEKDDPAGEYLKHKSFIVGCEVPDRIVKSDGLVDHAGKILRAIVPLNRFINEALGS